VNHCSRFGYHRRRQYTGQTVQQCVFRTAPIRFAPLQAAVNAGCNAGRLKTLLPAVITPVAFLRNTPFLAEGNGSVGASPHTFPAANAFSVIMANGSVCLLVESSIRASGNAHRIDTMVAGGRVKHGFFFSRRLQLQYTAKELTGLKVVVILAGELTCFAADAGVRIMIKEKIHRPSPSVRLYQRRAVLLKKSPFL